MACLADAKGLGGRVDLQHVMGCHEQMSWTHRHKDKVGGADGIVHVGGEEEVLAAALQQRLTSATTQPIAHRIHHTKVDSNQQFISQQPTLSARHQSKESKLTTCPNCDYGIIAPA